MITDDYDRLAHLHMLASLARYPNISRDREIYVRLDRHSGSVDSTLNRRHSSIEQLIVY